MLGIELDFSTAYHITPANNTRRRGTSAIRSNIEGLLREDSPMAGTPTERNGLWTRL
jgi:hypothetical protein